MFGRKKKEEIGILKEIEQDEREQIHLDREILDVLHPQLSFIKIKFGGNMAQGPVTLSQGQSTKATVIYFDQVGNPMPSGFVPPAVVYTMDNSAIASSAPEADGQTDDVAYVAAGVANLTATVQGPNGPLTDTETVTCSPVVLPPPVLSSVKIDFSTPTP